MEKKEGKGKKLGIYVENGLEYGVGVILEEVVTHERIVRKKRTGPERSVSREIELWGQIFRVHGGRISLK